jgi:hypothetical protein
MEIEVALLSTNNEGWYGQLRRTGLLSTISGGLFAYQASRLYHSLGFLELFALSRFTRAPGWAGEAFGTFLSSKSEIPEGVDNWSSARP